VVTNGQTVAPGQLLGYSGASGASSGPHLHFGLTRLSNTNGRTAAAGEAFGYHVPFRAVTSNNFGVNLESLAGAVDPYGWRAPTGRDPYGWMWANTATNGGVTGIGAWAPIMWIQSETPPYP
jgi:murein DD-endopeptidase MepM/ murein hydrolase activator NlpD